VQAPVTTTVETGVPSQARGATAEEVADLARWVSRGERPLILAGAMFTQVSHASLVSRLNGAAGIPALAMESPRGINDPALGAFAQVLARADRILLLGRGPDYCLGFAEAPVVDAACRFAQVEPERALIKRARRVLGKRLRRTLQADPGLTADALAHALAGREALPEWLDEVRAALSHRPPEWLQLAGDSEHGVHPAHACRAVHEFLEHRPDAILVADGGEFGQWAQACISTPRRIINGPSGAIGAGLSFAAGARLASPGAVVVAMLGDGTAGFHLAEFDTALRADAPFVAVIGNDARWNAEHQIQLRDYGPDRTVGCELLPTRYDRVVAAMGGHGEYVERAEELPGALERAKASGLPACVNVRLDGKAAPLIRL